MYLNNLFGKSTISFREKSMRGIQLEMHKVKCEIYVYIFLMKPGGLTTHILSGCEVGPNIQCARNKISLGPIRLLKIAQTVIQWHNF